MRLRSALALPVLFCAALPPVVAQKAAAAPPPPQAAAPKTQPDNLPGQRPYMLVLDGKITVGNSWWKSGQPLRLYSATHPGSYIVFLADGQLRRLDDPARLKQLEALWIPMRELGRVQESLGAQQRPLGEQQAALGQLQRTAATPAEQGTIGAAQGRIGQQQGIIGQQQGNIGRQQGIYGKAIDDSVQAMLEDCLKAATCKAVENTPPA